MSSFLFFFVICSKFLIKNNFDSQNTFSSLLDKKVVFQKDDDDDHHNKRNLASTTNKFHNLSINPSHIHINGGDEVEIQIDTPKSKEVYCKVGLNVKRGLNKDNKTMVCLLPQLNRQIFVGKNTIDISLSFDRIHWCEPYPLVIIPEDNSFSILGFLSFLAFGIVIIASIKMLFFDSMKINFRRRKPPRKKPDAFNRGKRSEVADDDPFVFNRKILGSSFL